VGAAVRGAALLHVVQLHARVGLERGQRGGKVLLRLVQAGQAVADLHRFGFHLLRLCVDLLVDLVGIAAEDALHRRADRLAGQLHAFLAGGDAGVGDAAEFAVIGDQQGALRIADRHRLAIDDEVALRRHFGFRMTGTVELDVLAPQRAG